MSGRGEGGNSGRVAAAWAAAEAMGVMGEVSGSVGWDDPAARSLHPPGLTSLLAALFLSTSVETNGPPLGRRSENPELRLLPRSLSAAPESADRGGGGLFQVSDEDNSRDAGVGKGGSPMGELTKAPGAMRRFRPLPRRQSNRRGRPTSDLHDLGIGRSGRREIRHSGGWRWTSCTIRGTLCGDSVFDP